MFGWTIKCQSVRQYRAILSGFLLFKAWLILVQGEASRYFKHSWFYLCLLLFDVNLELIMCHVILLAFILSCWWVCFLSCSCFKNLVFCFNVHQGTNFCTIGTTSKLIAGKGGWFYYSYSRSTKKIDHEDVTYTCSCREFNEKSILRCLL